mmetsp:Transcript_31886/g.79956  ORF Transcript_31886/g.79956 Transcript_31886/m.79956 type:complete len:218 (-) Transcript_31886:1214-1867(-)
MMAAPWGLPPPPIRCLRSRPRGRQLRRRRQDVVVEVVHDGRAVGRAPKGATKLLHKFILIEELHQFGALGHKLNLLTGHRIDPGLDNSPDGVERKRIIHQQRCTHPLRVVVAQCVDDHLDEVVVHHGQLEPREVGHNGVLLYGRQHGFDCRLQDVHNVAQKGLVWVGLGVELVHVDDDGGVALLVPPAYVGEARLDEAVHAGRVDVVRLVRALPFRI